jgi:hypothetical protein
MKRHIDEKRCKVLKNGSHKPLSVDNNSIIVDEINSLKKQMADLKNTSIANNVTNTETVDNNSLIVDEINSLKKQVEDLKNTSIINNITDTETVSDVDSLTETISDTSEHTNMIEIQESPNTFEDIPQSDEQIYKRLDEEAGYNYSKEHPMDGIRYESDRDKYDLVIDNKHNRSDDLHKLCELNRVNILGKFSGSVAEIHQVCKKLIKYRNNNIVSFWAKINDDIDPLFDIKHILTLMNVSDRTERRLKQRVSNDNKFIYFEPNEYDGYIVRELIDEKTMYQIVLDSRSEFSKSFKSDISDMLITLRKKGEIRLVIANMPSQQQQRRKGTIAKSQLSDLFLKDVIKVVNGGLDATDVDDMEYVEGLIKTGEEIHLTSYLNDHVMYFFITNILNPDNHVICKIGYTSNINKRIGTLSNEYGGTNFHLIGLKKIKNISDEENFHYMLKHRYPQLMYNGAIVKSVHKEELYIFDKCLWEEFSLLVDYYPEKILSMGDILNEYKVGTIDQETMKMMLRITESNIELEKMREMNKLADNSAKVDKDVMVLLLKVMKNSMDWKRYTK